MTRRFDETDVGDDIPRDRELGVLQAQDQPVQGGITIGADQPQCHDVALAGESQRLPFDRTEFCSKILSGESPTRARNARSKPAAAADIGIFIIGPVPDMPGRVRWFVAGDRGRSSNRRQSADRRLLLVQNG